MTSNKEQLKETVNFLTEDQARFIDNLIRAFSNRYISKTDLMNLTSKKENNYDTSLPLDYVRSIQDLIPEFNPFYNVFDYSDKYGKMLNISDQLINDIHQKLRR